MKKKIEKVKKIFADSMTCAMICGDGTGVDPEKHLLGCPKYSSGHSIDVNGNCNMGCC